ncbi:MAG: DNA-processing protein DprA [Terriglobales bacterium]
MDRGAALALLVERWTSHGLWVISRSDPEYPSRYKNYLQHAAPPVLFGVGEVSTLQCGGLAVVGSRDAPEDALEFARRIGTACASQRIPVISGAAKGIDSESMQSTVDQGGRSIGVLAEGLGRASVSPRYHDALLDGHLTLISPYEPDSRWFAHTAMERNKLVYSLADAALVVSSGDEKGGTWAGATEALRQKRIPVYVRTGDELPTGNRRLIQAGARPFSEKSWNDLAGLFQESPVAAPLFEQPSQELAPADECHDEADSALAAGQPAIVAQPEDTRRTAGALLNEKQQLQTDSYEYVAKLFPTILCEPRDERAFAEALNVVPAQAKVWLKRAVGEGLVRRLKKPVRYIAARSGASLFADK